MAAPSRTHSFTIAWSAIMPLYLLNIIQPDGPPPAPDALSAIMANVGAMIAETKTANAWVFNGGLTAPGASTVVRMAAGEVALTDGPYLEGKEFIGGFIIVRADDLDAALQWGTKLSRATTLPIEVRPFAWAGV
jgi:hypothetical protein